MYAGKGMESTSQWTCNIFVILKWSILIDCQAVGKTCEDHAKRVILDLFSFRVGILFNLPSGICNGKALFVLFPILKMEDMIQWDVHLHLLQMTLLRKM